MQSFQMTDMRHTFISMVDTTMSSLYRDKKDGENIGITGENKCINGLEIERVNNNIQPQVFSA